MQSQAPLLRPVPRIGGPPAWSAKCVAGQLESCGTENRSPHRSVSSEESDSSSPVAGNIRQNIGQLPRGLAKFREVLESLLARPPPPSTAET